MSKRNKRDISPLLSSIIRYANLGVARSDFLKKVSLLIIDFLECDAVSLNLLDYGKAFLFEAARQKRLPHEILENYHICNINQKVKIKSGNIIDNETLCLLYINSDYRLSGIDFSKRGSFYTKEYKGFYDIQINYNNNKTTCQYRIESGYLSLAVIPIKVENKIIGLLQLKSQSAEFFNDRNINTCETIAESIGRAALDRNRQIALKERVKELGCLYGISKIIEQSDLSLNEIFHKILDLIPPAWLYPEITAARIIFKGNTCKTSRFKETSQMLSSDIIVEGTRCGKVDIVYLENKPEIFEGPFLLEERKLLDAIAQQLAQIIIRKQEEEENLKLQDQIRHADRLATVGQLAAGVAHELNEPLANILGFAQILLDETGLPQQAVKDIKKIENASLYAREIVKKLLVFSRQVSQKKVSININRLIEDVFFFYESRCVKEGIRVVKNFEPHIIEFPADPAQIQQVVINLIVNALQAMSNGDTLTIETMSGKNNIILIIEDTGTGMSEEVRQKLFVPFFTTKDITEGTGLGLSVAHGIITSHGGIISVESEEGKGSRFEISLPVKHNTIINGES